MGGSSRKLENKGESQQTLLYFRKKTQLNLFKRIVGKPNFSDQLKKIIRRYKRVGYNMNAMRQSACLAVNPITVDSYGFLLNCMTVGQALDLMPS